MSTLERFASNYAFPQYGAAADPQEIAPRVWWLSQCLEVPLAGLPTHVHTAPYLLLGSEQTLLWDTGPPTEWDSVHALVARVLGERRLDWIVPSHPEVAHAGNVARLLAAYPEARVLGDVRDYHVFFPGLVDRFVAREQGRPLDLGGVEFTLVPALIKDLPSSQWGYESNGRVLFVADAFSYSHQPPLPGDDRPLHLPGECVSTSSELGAPPGPEQVVWITKAALYWTRFVPLDDYRQELEDLLQRYPAELIAPAHGAVIDNPDDVLPAVWRSLALAYDPEAGAKAAGVSLFVAG
jgi:flavorubredoxin